MVVAGGRRAGRLTHKGERVVGRGRKRGMVLMAAGLVLVAALLLSGAFATGLGRVLADVWVSALTAIAGLLGGLFGA